MSRRPQQRWAVLLLLALVALAWLLRMDRGGQSLPDMTAYTVVEERKQAFFDYLEPIVERENARIAEDRRRLLDIAARHQASGGLCWWDRRWLRNLAAEYRVQWQPDKRTEAIESLKTRVDAVPAPLALVQAAKESGWGRSRYAVAANNLFGQWCYERGCGLVPKRRPRGASHEVRIFDSVADAVAAYVNNLNSHRSYRGLRRIRSELRERGEEPTALALAEGLMFYSERRGAYVAEVRSMIRQYHRFRNRSEDES